MSYHNSYAVRTKALSAISDLFGDLGGCLGEDHLASGDDIQFPKGNLQESFRLS